MIDEKKLIEIIENRQRLLSPGIDIRDSLIFDTLESLIDTINDMDKIEWIPVSERLPYDGETCLITNAESFEQYHIYKGWYDGIKGVWHMTGNFERKMNVIAWQPLPEPYKEKQNA